MFGKLRRRVWDNKHLTVKTKMIVYVCALNIPLLLLSSSSSWISTLVRIQDLDVVCQTRTSTQHLLPHALYSEHSQLYMKGLGFEQEITKDCVASQYKRPALKESLKG